MKREFSPVYLALVLVLGCVLFRLLSSEVPELIPNISPLMAIAYVGAMYLPRRWGWLVGPVALLLTDLAFVEVNYRTDGSGSMFSWWTSISVVVYAAAGGLGILISRRKSLATIIGGSIACSLLFYLVSNTFSWWHDVVIHMTPGYPATLAYHLAGFVAPADPSLRPVALELVADREGQMFERLTRDLDGVDDRRIGVVPVVRAKPESVDHCDHPARRDAVDMQAVDALVWLPLAMQEAD